MDIDSTSEKYAMVSRIILPNNVLSSYYIKVT